MYDRLNQREITNPHLLTTNAKKVQAGKPVRNLSDEDMESIHLYCERLEIVDKIVTNVFNHFKV